MMAIKKVYWAGSLTEVNWMSSETAYIQIVCVPACLFVSF